MSHLFYNRCNEFYNELLLEYHKINSINQQSIYYKMIDIYEKYKPYFKYFIVSFRLETIDETINRLNSNNFTENILELFYTIYYEIICEYSSYS